MRGRNTLPGEAVLAELGLGFEPPHARVPELRFVYRGRAYAIYGDPVFRIARRDVFDHWLLGKAREKGVEVRPGEAVTEARTGKDHVSVRTDKGEIQAGVLVGADGSFSMVRRAMNLHAAGRMARTLEVVAPEKGIDLRDGVAVFDVTTREDGLQGYYWDFPCVIGNRPFMNRGVYDSRVHSMHSRASLKGIFRESLAERRRRLAAYALKSSPIYLFDKRGPFARPRVLLAGDAAGVDPFLGEGISFALGYGRVAASAVIDAFGGGDFSFSEYGRRILTDPMLSQFPLRVRLARFFYGLKHRWQFEIAWRLAPLLVRVIARLRPGLLHFEASRLVKIDGK